MARSVPAAVAVTALLIGLGAASPASANFVATGHDPAGDSLDPHPGRDIVAVALTYDRRTGRLQGGVRLRGEARGDAPANLTLFAGTRTATGCDGYPAIGFATQTDLRGADWVRLRAAGAPPAGTGTATKSFEGAGEGYEATAGMLRAVRPNCVVAQLNEPGNPAVVYDVAGPYVLHKRPELEAKLGTLPPAMRPGQTRTVRLTLRNPGDASTGPLRLTVATSRGTGVKMPRAIGGLRPGQKRVVRVKVTLGAKARTATTLRVTAVAKSGLKARDEGTLYLRRPSSPGSGSGGGGGTGGDSGVQLCFRYTWLPPYSTLVPC